MRPRSRFSTFGSSARTGLRSAVSGLSLDTTPLRESRTFRWLIASRTISLFGAQGTAIALLVQAKQLTGSPLAVGLLGAVEILPAVIFGLYGGQLADRVDRRKLALLTEAGLGAVASGLLLNALQARPLLWPLYVGGAATVALAALQRPSLDATVPRIVAREQLTAASAALALSSNASFVLGSAIGGVVIAELGADVAYAVDACTYVASALCLQALGSLPANTPAAAGERAVSWRATLAGWRYVAGRQELIGSYLVDLAAMTLAFPEALYPFMASTLHARWALGLMFSASAAGAALASATSGWASRITRHGLAIAAAGVAWGAAVAMFGIAPNLATALVALIAAGAADLLSGLFRDTLWNQTIDDHMRGRVAGIEVVSYTVGPSVGQLRAGAIAGAVNPRFSLYSGGALCVLTIALVCWRLPKFNAYDAMALDDGTTSDL